MLADCKHRGAVRIRPPAAVAGVPEWGLAMRHFPDSAAIVWPAVKKTVPGHEDQYLELVAACSEPTFVAVTDVTTHEAFAYEWKSPYSQMLRFLACYGKAAFRPGVRAFMAGKVQTFVMIVALAGGFMLSKTEIGKLCSFIGCAVPPGSDLFYTLYCFVEFSL